tara:strand:+ start:10 stop:768 length:759 start_codon:yes stop_codon:yes gene_type:complete
MSRHQALDTFGRSGNPVFGNKFDGDAQFRDLPETQKMTLDGTVNKTGLLLALCFTTAAISWNMPNPALMGFGAIGGIVLALITIFRPTSAGTTAPLYAASQGLFLGGITVIFEAQFPGIAIQAIGLTFGTLASLLVCYKTGVIKPTENFRLMIVSATAGIALLYIVNIAMMVFGSGEGIGFIHSSGTFGIIFSLAVVAIAALNLVLDFDFIEQGSENGLPKHMEWFGAFSLMVTLVWLYLEILRLIAKLRSN